MRAALPGWLMARLLVGLALVAEVIV
ncbi:MAG: hypothetical protein JWL70_1859, partial [Acidimicrobiia bacterium]|nr:hypothetical protein [Acidimicrobiia bacterium]